VGVLGRVAVGKRWAMWWTWIHHGGCPMSHFGNPPEKHSTRPNKSAARLRAPIGSQSCSPLVSQRSREPSMAQEIRVGVWPAWRDIMSRAPPRANGVAQHERFGKVISCRLADAYHQETAAAINQASAQQLALLGP